LAAGLGSGGSFDRPKPTRDHRAMARHALITGGAGFIGSHLAEQLVSEGNDVTILDDLSTGRLENLAGLLGRPNVRFIRQSVEDEATVSIAMSRCDIVYHLAAAVGVQLIVDRPVHTIRTIIRGTEVVLEAANRYRVPVLVTSSSEVYGKGSRVPFAEDDDVVMGPTRHARWCYAYAKGIDEFLGLAYHKEYDTPVTIVRLFNTVGPRQVGMYGMVLPRFVDAALAGRPLQVYGDGTQTRCFCHVADVVSALMRLTTTPGTVGQVYNLGGTEEVSIGQLAERVIAMTASRSTVERLSYEQAYGQQFDDLPRRVPDLSRIRAAIGFEPRHSLEQIIRSVIEERRRGG
jgi:UDP-glucose 4-epimerase